MAVKITNRQYKNQFHNNSESVDWLLGNVGDWIELTLTVEVLIDFKASNGETVTHDFRNNTFVLNNGKKWSDYGFDNGDSVRFSAIRNGGAVQWNINIANLFGDTMEYSYGGSNEFFPQGVMPYRNFTSDGEEDIVENVQFLGYSEPQGLKFNYSHLSNDEFDSTNLGSLIDGSVPEFSFAGLNTISQNVKTQMNPDGLQSGMGIDSCFITKKARNGDAYVYDVSVIFLLGLFFENPSDLESGTTPPVLLGLGSLTDNFLLRFFPEWNNPNTVISNDLKKTERLGNTGWFNENFNGLDNNFVIDDVSFEDENGSPLSELDYSKPTIVTIEASGIPNLGIDSEFGFGFAWIPQNEADYFDKNTPHQENLIVNTGRKFEDGDNDSFNLNEDIGTTVLPGFGQVERIDVEQSGLPLFSVGGTDKVIFKAKFTPNIEFVNFFEERGENDRNYILWVSVANHDLAINFSDRVSLLAKYGSMIKVVAPAGPYPGMINKFIEHPQSENVEGVDKYFGFVEDDVLSRIQFSVDKTTDTVINSMSFGYEVKNVDTGLYYSLENISISLDDFKKDNNGAQQIEFNEVRGFKLESGNNKDWVRINRDPSKDSGDNFAYLAHFATKIRWEDWLLRDNVPDEYFDTSKENNGQNNDWLDYLRSGNLNSHDFFFVVYTEVVENGQLKVYKNEYEITFADYDENLNIETEHNYFRDSDDTNVNVGLDPDTGKMVGVILSDEPTRIEITYTNLTEDFDFDFMYATICMEIERGAGQFDFRQLSSRWGSEADNPLIPLDGETKLKFELVSPRVIKTSCLIDPNKLEQVLRYKITGRIGCWAESADVDVPDGIYESLYENTYE